VTHPLAVVLALAAGAVVAGIRSFTAIAGWVEDAPAELLTGKQRVCRAARDGPSAVGVGGLVSEAVRRSWGSG
jgi:hypothetical protein